MPQLLPTLWPSFSACDLLGWRRMASPSQCALKGQHLDSSPPWSPCVFVWSGYYNKPWGLPKNRKIFFTVLETEKSKVKLPADSVFGEGLLSHRQLFTVSSQGRSGQGAFSGLFYKDTNPTHKASTLMTDHLPEAPPPNTNTLGDRIQQTDLGKTQTFHLERPGLHLILQSSFY